MRTPGLLRFYAVFGFCALVLSVASSPVESREVRLGTNIAAHQFRHADGGGSVGHVACILERLGGHIDVVNMPWRRARQEVSSAKIDGFFTAIPIPEVDRYASLSAPLVLENWYWFWRSDDSAPETWLNGHRIGAILGSHQSAWLNQNDYPVHLEVGNLEQLVKLLLSGRIDAFIADREHLEMSVSAMGMSENAYQLRFLRYVPLGVYFGHEFLAREPGFLADFNRHTYSCAPKGFQMSDSEQKTIRQWLEPVLDNWLQQAPIKAGVIAQNLAHRDMTDARLRDQNERWMGEFQTGDYDFSRQVLERDLSRRLRELAVDTDGKISEVILTDEHGLNVAMNDITSDYWQGNESKFLQAWPLARGELHFDPVRYDESVRRFQVHVSRPLFHPETDERIGVLVVGVDVERTLSLDH